jgi:hypothetical protein
MTVTVASASGCDEAQVWSVQAITVPLMVKPVTVRETGTDCVFPTTEPVLSIAVMVMVPVYVPGSTFTAETFTPNELPVPLSVPEDAVNASHGLLVEACQVTGRAQVPLSLNITLSADEVVCPCANEMARWVEKDGQPVIEMSDQENESSEAAHVNRQEENLLADVHL